MKFLWDLIGILIGCGVADLIIATSPSYSTPAGTLRAAGAAFVFLLVVVTWDNLGYKVINRIGNRSAEKGFVLGFYFVVAVALFMLISLVRWLLMLVGVI